MLKFSFEFVTIKTIRGNHRKHKNVDGNSVCFKRDEKFLLLLKSCKNGVIDILCQGDDIW